MAVSRPISVHDQMTDVTECSICMEVYANPKILPCVHTFCLQCLERYGRERKPGDQMTCPICKNEFSIPDGGFCSLQHNFFIDKMVEIRKLSETSTNEALCGTCPDEDRIMAKMFCFECEQNLCDRCAIAHNKIKFCQNHQVVEIGTKLKPQEVTFRNSCCDQHPGELVKMYCVDDKATICFLCFAENHQSHKCLSVTKASEEFSNALKSDLKTVNGTLSYFQRSTEYLGKWEEGLLTQSIDVEKQLFDEAVRIKAFIDSHANILAQKLTALKDTKLKEIDSKKQDMERYKATIESYIKYSKELLNKGAPGDICREADQLKTRARELALLEMYCYVPDFNSDGIIFESLNLEDVLHMNSIANVIGDVRSSPLDDYILPFSTHDADIHAIISNQDHFEKKELKAQAWPSYPWLDLTTDSESSGTVSAKTKSEIPTSLTHAFDPRAVHFILKRPELQMHIENSLEKLNCHVEWSTKGKGEVKLEFKGKEKQKPAVGWDVECKKVLQSYADELTWKKENVLQEMWTDFKKKIQEQITKRSKLLDTAFENDQCEIQYIGLKKHTDEFEQIFKEIKGELEKELERKKKRISEPVTNLKQHQLALIRTQEFKNKLRQEIPDLEFEIKQTEVNLCGMPDVVKKAKLFILEKVTGAVQDSFEISESTSRVFANDEAKPYLMEQLLNKGISASWTCNDRSVVVFVLDEKKLKDAVEVLKKEVVEEHIHLSKASEALIQSSQWKNFTASLYTDYKPLEVAVMGPTVVAACTRNIADDVLNRLNGFIDKHPIVEKVLPMDLGVVEVITKYMNNELQKIEAELKECAGGIDACKDEPGFIIKGNETGVGKAAKDLQKLTDSIIMYDHDIDRPGIPAYFYSKHGKEVLRGIQTIHKVSIQLDNTQERAKPQAVGGDGPEMCRVEVRPGKFMILMRGDITKCNVDAIVNAANEKLEHIGGVAAAIAEAAGPNLEEDCWSRIKLVGPLLPGQACVTRAGKLPCKKVIHAVGPRWSGGKNNEDSILAVAVDSSLSAANEEGLKSIAMPSISTGIFGFPLDRATDIIVEAVKNYFVDNSSTTVREVVFIDSDSRAVASLDKKLRTIQIDGPRDEAKKGRRMVAGSQDYRPSQDYSLPQDYSPPQNQRPPPNTIQRDTPGSVSNWIRSKVGGRGNDEYSEHYAGSMQKTRATTGPRQLSRGLHEERQPQDLSRIILSIYALSRKAIDDVLKDIEEVIREYLIDKVLNSPKDQENIAKLNPEQIKRIKDMADIYPVQIEVETGRLKRIRIHGPPMAVTSVLDQVYSIFQSMPQILLQRFN